MTDQFATILFAGNDLNTAVPLVVGLQDHGYRVLHATDSYWVPRLACAAQPDLVLLDTSLPRLDSIAVCRALRQKSTVPILLLTRQNQEWERIRGLELGADACLVKPFSFRELLARVHALLRRRGLNGGNGSPPGGRIVVGDIVLDRATRQVWRAGRLVKLRRREYDVLRALMENAGRAMSRHELLDQVWGEDWIGDPRTVDVHVCWLRRKLEVDSSTPRYIQTVHGYGYRFVSPTLRRTPRQAQEGPQGVAASPAVAA